MRNRLLFLCLTVLTILVLAQFQGETRDANQVETAASKAAPRVFPNRTLPKVDPPRTTLEFPTNPTPQDFFRARVFDEPLVPIGGEPSRAENAALATALLRYSQRAGPDDFSSLTSFLREHPESPWCASLLTDLGIEYYNTAHYSLALDAWASGSLQVIRAKRGADPNETGF